LEKEFIMKIGLVFPQTEFSQDTASFKDYAQTAEDLGFTHILAYEHVLGVNSNRPGGWQGIYSHEDPFYEVFCLFSFMASVTTKLEFTTGILILPQRQTSLVAKQAATLDVLSGGRLRLGVGLGWNQVEYTALNEDFTNRGKRVEEQVELLRKLWTEPLVTFKGKWHNIPDAGLNPLPIQRPIPVWFGGYHEKVLRRIGKMGDGWMPGHRKADDAKPDLEIIAATAEQAGRDPDAIGLEPRMPYGEGNPETWHKNMVDWREIGATHLSLNTMDLGFNKPQQHLKAIRTFAEAMDINS
jgi:probable F420-dependent oxidoreductase